MSKPRRYILVDYLDCVVEDYDELELAHCMYDRWVERYKLKGVYDTIENKWVVKRV